MPAVPRFTGVTVMTGPRCVVSAAVCFLDESTTQAERRSGRREAGGGRREERNQSRMVSIGGSGERRRGAILRKRQSEVNYRAFIAAASRLPLPASRFPLNADQIPPARLCPVQCPIGAVEQIFRRLDFRLGEIGDADAHGELERFTLADVEGMRLDPVAQSLSERDRAGFAGFGNGDDELVATVTGYRIDAA